MAESFLNGKVILHRGDCLEVLPTLEEASVDSCVCDPPYHLTSIVKRFGAENSAPAQVGKTGAYERASRGFMGKVWDGGDIAFRPEVWREVLRVLKPGGHLLAFGGTRTYHGLASAIEAAGFDVRDALMWHYGQGFPKSHNIGDGWGTALKPATEIICLARKPISESSIAANVLKHGTGALNIDGCRVEANGEPTGTNGHVGLSPDRGWNANSMPRTGTKPQSTTQGRWPANLIHDGSEEVLAGFPETQSGAFNQASKRAENNIYGKHNGYSDPKEYAGDSGSAARFFYSVQFSEDDLAWNHHVNGAGRCSLGCHPQKEDFALANVSPPALRNLAQNVKLAGVLCDSCAIGIAQWLAELRRRGQPGNSLTSLCIDTYKGTILSQSLASYVANRENTDTILTIPNLTQLFGSVFHAIDAYTNSESHEQLGKSEPKRFWYTSKADADDRLGSRHPTVKPLDLIQYLVRLITPKGGLVIDPFAGTGTTGEAAFREGMAAILIEREPEYQADIVKRMGLVLAGPDTRRASSIKQDNLDDCPLFGGAA